MQWWIKVNDPGDIVVQLGQDTCDTGYHKSEKLEADKWMGKYSAVPIDNIDQPVYM